MSLKEKRMMKKLQKQQKEFAHINRMTDMVSEYNHRIDDMMIKQKEYDIAHKQQEIELKRKMAELEGQSKKKY